jgi:peptidoglycan hydrolase-like protein with peptidoglycan-binding domain
MKRLIPLTLLGCIGVATPGNALVALPAIPTTVMATSGIVTVAYDERVERAQSWLNRLGFDAGPVDGYMGSRTRSAISAYQRSRGQVVTGTPDRSTMRSLREEYRVATGAEPRDRNSSTAAAETNTAVANQSSLPTPGATQLVVDTQVELRRRGYDVPVVNGVIDTKTQDAIRTFERDQRLLVTGQPSALLLERIRSTDAALSRRDMIRLIQATLTERGYQPGPSDGVMGQDRCRPAGRRRCRCRPVGVIGQAETGREQRSSQACRAGRRGDADGRDVRRRRLYPRCPLAGAAGFVFRA